MRFIAAKELTISLEFLGFTRKIHLEIVPLFTLLKSHSSFSL
jgi:hypothetical protein